VSKVEIQVFWTRILRVLVPFLKCSAQAYCRNAAHTAVCSAPSLEAVFRLRMDK
jgi:hypothetical protein